MLLLKMRIYFIIKGCRWRLTSNSYSVQETTLIQLNKHPYQNKNFHFRPHLIIALITSLLSPIKFLKTISKICLSSRIITNHHRTNNIWIMLPQGKVTSLVLTYVLLSQVNDFTISLRSAKCVKSNYFFN